MWNSTAGEPGLARTVPTSAVARSDTMKVRTRRYVRKSIRTLLTTCMLRACERPLSRAVSGARCHPMVAALQSYHVIVPLDRGHALHAEMFFECCREALRIRGSEQSANSNPGYRG